MIAFKNPEYLFFLFAIAIPIIIHLFSFRRYKKVYFHNLQFIREIQIEQNSTKSKLKELLILAARIATILFLVLTFAQPYIPYNKKTANNSKPTVAIYIDNSFSTQAESSLGVILNVEKEKAREIIDAYSNETSFYLFSNTAKSTDLREKTKDEIKKEIQEIHWSPNTTLLSDIYKKIQTCANQQNQSLRWHIITDAQKSTCDIAEITIDSNVVITIHPIENLSKTNLSIDSCYFENLQHISGETENLTVRISNHSDDIAANIPIKLFINDTVKAIGTTSVKAHSTNTVTLQYKTAQTGIISGYLQIEDYPILYDNTYYFSYYIEKQVPIIDIYEKIPNKYIAALCKDKPTFSIQEQDVRAIDYSQLRSYSVIILDELQTIPSGLVDAIAKLNGMGKTIICIPSNDVNQNSYNNLFKLFGNQTITGKDTSAAKIAEIDRKSSIFSSILDKKENNTIYPEISQHYVLTNTQNNALITLHNGHAYLTQLARKNNTLFTFASAMTSKNAFATSPLFMSFYNILLATSAVNGLQHTIGNSCELCLPNLQNDEALHITNKELDIIPQFRIDMQTAKVLINPMQQITKDGNYFITQKGTTINGISYNYDRSESQLQFYTNDELQDILSLNENANLISQETNLSAAIQEQAEGKNLWRIMLVCTIISILLEIALILFYDKIIQNKRKEN
ncbi:MAG: BatA domain-containing protein [Bacteroidales bacterium]|nr:BatA domain-containing protein [Bacteroidales bacterium]